jgi:parvulin-like peptidyl-prolyl isomerase
MKRLVVASAALAALALVSSACSSTDPSAVSVNGQQVASVADVEDALKTFAGLDCEPPAEDPDGTGATGAQGCANLKAQVQGASSGTASTDFAGRLITAYINTELLRQEAERRDLLPDQAALDTVRETAADQTFGEGGSLVFDQLPADQQAFWVERIALIDALRPVLDVVPDAELQSAYESNPTQFTEVCLRHILVDTEDEANAILAELEGGADFATLAQERSTDTGSGADGGKLYQDGQPCPRAANFVPEFAEASLTAEPGEPVGPVQTQFGYHIILADQPANLLPLDEVREEVQQVAQGGTSGLNTFLQAEVKKADVDLNPRFGTWKDGVLIPPGAEVTTVAPDTTAEG